MRDSEQIDKRSHPRYPVKDGAMAALSLINEISYYKNFGSIVDISKGGLAFEYESGQQGEKGEGLMSLIGLEKSIFVKDVPYEVVYDYNVGSEGKPGKNRCGLKFSNLSRRQTFEVNLFISKYAVWH